MSDHEILEPKLTRPQWSRQDSTAAGQLEADAVAVELKRTA